jgi:hypothetical protein
MFITPPPELPELPEIVDQSLNAYMVQRLNTPQLPGIPILNSAALLGYNPRAIEAERLAAAMRVAFEITRRQNAIAAARAGEMDRAAQRLVERRRAWWR